MKQFSEKAFTLVELLIVIGIIGILAVTLLVSLNPAEAQRKSRDAKRLKDAALYESVFVQLINDNVDLTSATVATTTDTKGINTAGAKLAQTQNCSSNWLGVNICDYAKTAPLDPSNSRKSKAVTSSSGTSDVVMQYAARISGSDYEINVRQESLANSDKVTGDGGTDDAMYELFSGNGTLITSGDAVTPPATQ